MFTFPRTPQQLADAGLLTKVQTNPGPRRALIIEGSTNYPAKLSEKMVIARLLDLNTRRHTVIFGDWHVEPLTDEQWQTVLRTAREATRSARQGAAQ